MEQLSFLNADTNKECRITHLTEKRQKMLTWNRYFYLERESYENRQCAILWVIWKVIWKMYIRKYPENSVKNNTSALNILRSNVKKYSRINFF